MKNKIAWKLAFYFSVVLLLFSLIIGSLFTVMFRSYTINLQKNELETRAVTMAKALAKSTADTAAGSGMGNRQGNYGFYLRFLNEIAMTDAWVVDENLELITGNQLAGTTYLYADLPQNAEAVVKEVFIGNTTFSEGFSSLLNTPTLTVGTPIRSNGKIVGALLLHSPVEGINESVKQGYQILAVSMVAALILSGFLSILLAVTFSKPLQKMKNVAMQLASGDYTVKTEIQQKDEIGELAASIDILSERLETASHESEHLNQLRRDFIANISHELRTPITVIRGSLEALCDEVITEPTQVKAYHLQMWNESLFLQRLVNDLLDLSRLQNTDFQIDLQEVSLCEVLEDAVRSARQMAQAKQIQIELELKSELCVIHGDYGRLRQMFLIILDNAVKFSPKNGSVLVLQQDNTVSIRDHGIGIAEEELPYIFERFYQVQSEENKSGTGLGLAIAKQIAERHAIELSVESKIGIGTEFRFTLKQ